MDLTTALKDAEAALRNLDAAVADAFTDFTKKAEREAKAAAAIHAQEVEELKEKIEELKEDHEAELKDKLEGLQEAEELLDDVYTIERKGVLDTASPVKRLVFEKLAERWDSLTNAELEDLEALLDGKLNYL